MARLEKSLQDYFKLPILLEALSENIGGRQSFSNLYEGLTIQPILLPIDERYQLHQSAKQISSMLSLSNRVDACQRLQFKKQENLDEWKQLEVIYNYRFTIGVYDITDKDQKDQLGELWEKFKKQKKEQNKIVLGLIIPNTSEAIDFNAIQQDSYIIIPETMPIKQIIPFLEPWLYSCLSKAQHHICKLINSLQSQDCSFIVFNKNEEKPEMKILKKKKKGRFLKISGDFSLMIQCQKQAYRFYLEAEELLRKTQDSIWLLSCLLGKLACLVTETQQSDKNQLTEEVRAQCLFLSKKIKQPKLQAQTYFKILKIYIKVPEKFDEIAHSYSMHISMTHSNAQKFTYFVQLAQLYKQANLLHRYASLIYQSAIIILEMKPKIGLMLLDELKNNSKIKEWPLLYSYVLKLEIQHNSTPNSGLLHLQMLENCSNYLSFKNLQSMIDSLNYAGFSDLQLDRPILFIELVSITIAESPKKPKINRISKQYQSPLKNQGGSLVINWRKQQKKILLFQKEEQIKIHLNINNKLNTSLSLQIGIRLKNQPKIHYQAINLLGSCPNTIEYLLKLSEIGEYQVQKIECRIWNFTWSMQLPYKFKKEQCKIQIYEEYPEFQILVENAQLKEDNSFRMLIEQSSKFSFKVNITRNRPRLKLSHVKLTAAVYYHLDVGLQETEFMLQEFTSPSKSSSPTFSQTYFISSEEHQKQQSLKLKKLKVDKKWIKKIQLKLECIRTAQSKFQMDKQLNIICQSFQDIWCSVQSITTEIHNKQWYRKYKNKQEVEVIEQNYMVLYRIQKKVDNRKTYILDFEGQQFLLGQNTTLQVYRNYPKMNESDLNGKFEWNEQIQGECALLNIQWKNLLDKSESGIIRSHIPKNIKHMKLNPIKIDFTVAPLVQSTTKSPIKIVSQSIIHIQYSIKTQEQHDLSHQVVIQPIIYPQLKKYMLSGKTVIRSKQKIVKNRLKLKFCYEFKQKYAIGLRFKGFQYWYPELIQLDE